MSAKPKVITIIGPTASGKTSFSLKLSDNLKKKFSQDIEIISADSRQVYKHIPITTAQPTAEELIQYRHHFINELELEEEFNAGEFGIKARELIRRIFDEGKIPVIVGGSGLYINSLIYGLFEHDGKSAAELKKKQQKLRAELYKRIETEGLEPLIAELKIVDPVTLEKMTDLIKQNSRRYAKRQLTWFRRDNKIEWLKPGASDFPDFDDLEY